VANRDEVLGAIGKLAAPIRKNLGDTTPESAQLQAEETFTTSSLEAAHYYSQATDLAESGKSNDAVQLWLKAVKEDPNMGRVYSNLAVASINAKKPQEAAEYYKKALSLLDRMSEREKYRTLGTYYSAFLHNYPQAIENYERLTFLYPGDAPGFNNLSIAYVFSMDFPKAVSAIKKAIEISPHSLQFHLNYALYSMYAGDFSTATNEAQYIIQQNPSYRFAYLPLGLSQLARGDSDGAQATYAKLEKIDAETASVANIGQADAEMYFGHYKKALEILDKGIAADQKEKNTGEMAVKNVTAGEAYLALGDKPHAIQRAQEAVKLNPDESVAYPAARILIAAGRDDDARKIASTLDNTLQTQSRSYSQLIRGEIDMQYDRMPQAMDELREGEKLHDSWISHFLLGRAYLQASHFPEAAAEFETCRKRQGETADLMFADTATLHSLPPLYYWLARAQQEAGMKAAAQGNYQQFLKLRADADPGDLLAAEAKKMAGTSAQN
jgi:tetratricopeptide (TPR) repeat protein